MFISSRLRPVLSLMAAVTLAACSSAPAGTDIYDPYEDTNRQVHAFNKGVDRAVLRPAGQVAAATPGAITDRVTNFADNVGLPGMVANGILQGDVGGVGTNTFRFILNTTIGIAGLFDPAGAIGLTEQSTDFGETLAVWGAPEGAYIEVPFFGPSTERDAAGIFVDLFLDPLASVGTTVQADYGGYTRAADLVITRGAFLETIDGVLYDSADSYSAARIAYLQNRRFELGEAPSAATIDPFADDLFLEGFE